MPVFCAQGPPPQDKDHPCLLHHKPCFNVPKLNPWPARFYLPRESVCPSLSAEPSTPRLAVVGAGGCGLHSARGERGCPNADIMVREQELLLPDCQGKERTITAHPASCRGWCGSCWLHSSCHRSATLLVCILPPFNSGAA